MARRFTPLSNILSRGMKQTNSNIGQMNLPPQGMQKQPNYLNPQGIHGFENQGSGIGNYLNPPNNFKNPSPIGNSVGAMGGGNIYDPGNWSGEGIPDEQEVPGGPGVGGWYNPWGPDPDYEPGTYKPPEAPDIGGIVSNENFLPNWKDDTDLGGQTGEPTDPLPPGWEWQLINGNWEPVQSDTSGIDPSELDLPGYLEEDSGIKAPPLYSETSPSYTPPLGIMEEGFDFNNDGVVDINDVIEYQAGGGSEQGYIDNILNWLSQNQYAPQEFTGGGGQGGQAARKLYYPGTSGGFTSVGSGIGGGNTLDELLKQLRG